MPVEQGHGCQCQELDIQSPSEQGACHTIEPHGVPWWGGRSREKHGEAFVLNVVGEVQAYPGCLNDFSGFWATGLCLDVLTLILGWLGPVASSLKSKLGPGG